MNPENLTGRAAGKVEDYLRETVNPILKENASYLRTIDKNVMV